MKRLAAVLVLGAGMIGFLPAGAGAVPPAHTTIRVSDGPGGQADAGSYRPVLSHDGRYAAYVTFATNLASNDTNGWSDVVVTDNDTGMTETASVAHDGSPLDAEAKESALSADGRYVAFRTGATNALPPELVFEMTPEGPALAEVPADTNDEQDVYVRDRVGGDTIRASIAADGTEPDGHNGDPSISADGRYVAFTSEADNLSVVDDDQHSDIFVKDIQSGALALASRNGAVAADESSYHAVLSGSGRYVAFTSDATNLVPGDDNGRPDAYLHDLQTGLTVLVSATGDGSAGNQASSADAVSADGRYVLFTSLADDLVAGDGNGVHDVFVRDTIAGDTHRVSHGNGGIELELSSSGGGISADGRYVAFRTTSEWIIPGYVDEHDSVAVRVDLQTGVVEAPFGTRRDGIPAISADGHTLGIASDGTGIVTPDTNDAMDVFVHRLTEPVAGYWLLESDGDVHAFSGVDDFGGVKADLAPGATAVAIVGHDSGHGYWVLASDGDIIARGVAHDFGQVAPTELTEPGERVSTLSTTGTGTGMWVFTTAGRVLSFGTAPAAGELANTDVVLALDLDGPVIDSVASPTGLGAYMVASDGGIFTVGDAVFIESVRGALTALHGPPGLPDQPVVGIVADPDGHGYWNVAADGGVFAFGSDFVGSLPEIVAFEDLDAPINGMVPYGDGYLMSAADGGLFAFSDLPFAGSAHGLADTPVVAIAAAS